MPGLYDFCFYSPSQHTIIDFAVKVGNRFISHIHSQTLEMMQARYADAQVLTADEAIRLKEEGFKCSPSEITAEQYEMYLCQLPPKNWRSCAEGTSFMCIEHVSGNITSIYAQIGERFFALADSAFMPHAEIIAAVKASAAYTG